MNLKFVSLISILVGFLVAERSPSPKDITQCFLRSHAGTL